MKADFLPCGDTGLTVQLGEAIDRVLSGKVMGLRTLIREQQLPGIIETVPTYRSLTVHYDPLVTSHVELKEKISGLVDKLESEQIPESSHFQFPVCFDSEEFAPDLQHVAQWAKMSTHEIVEAIATSPLFVYMLGFAPGQPYMGDLPDKLAIPRRKDPVPRIKRGSLVIATGLAVIYPVDNPTGWHIVGRTPVPLFTRDAKQPTLLTPGDTVSFRPVSESEYKEINQSMQEGSYTIERIS